MPRLLLFAAVTAGLAALSRASLRAPGSHGFYRFFAWECLVALFLLNVGAWFADPFSLRQLASWTLLALSLGLVISGLRALRRAGRPDPRRDDATLLGPEKTTRLVDDGPYRWIRHPLYSSLLCLGWGILLKRPTWPAAALAVVATACLYLTARAEEAENLRFFGDAYRRYMRRTKRFIPFVW